MNENSQQPSSTETTSPTLIVLLRDDYYQLLSENEELEQKIAQLKQENSRLQGQLILERDNSIDCMNILQTKLNSIQHTLLNRINSLERTIEGLTNLSART